MTVAQNCETMGRAKGQGGETACTKTEGGKMDEYLKQPRVPFPDSVGLM